MQLRVLGGHQVASSGGGPIAFLIDERIAIDAGGLVGGLSMPQQNGIDCVLLTHYHYDHVRDLPFLGLAALDTGRQVDIYCTQIVKDALQQHLLCPPLWIDLFAGLDPNRPTFLHRPVVPGTPFEVGGYDVLPIDNRHHAVPVVGYQVATPEGRRLVYTGDTGPGIHDTWHLVDPDVLITEVTWPNDMDSLGRAAGHMTPRMLEAELVALREMKGKLPRILVCHVNQRREDEVVAELNEVAQRLHASIELAREGTLIDL